MRSIDDLISVLKVALRQQRRTLWWQLLHCIGCSAWQAYATLFVLLFTSLGWFVGVGVHDDLVGGQGASVNSTTGGVIGAGLVGSLALWAVLGSSGVPELTLEDMLKRMEVVRETLWAMKAAMKWLLDELAKEPAPNAAVLRVETETLLALVSQGRRLW